MVLTMARPWKHPDTGIYWFRKRVPDALRAVVGKREEKFSLKTREPDEAKRLHAAALLEIETRWANLAQPEKGVTELEAMELARPCYEWLRQTFADNPSEQTVWDPDLYDQLFTPVSYAPVGSLSEFLLAAPSPSLKRESMLAVVVERSDDILRKSGTRLTAIGIDRLRKAVAAALQAAALDLRKLGQFAPFSAGSMNAPPVHTPPTKTSPAVTFLSLVEGWALEKRPVEKTRYMWERVFKELAGHVGHADAAQLTADDVVRWKEELLKRGLSPRTVRNSKLAPLNAVLRWAAQNHKLASNVAEKVDVSAKAKPGQGRRGFTDDEADKILAAARLEKAAHLRWLPWLSAYTGARISELCQLRREDVFQVGKHWVVRITAEAGSIKNVHSERTVPIHSRLIQQGFLKFVDTVKSGPLFKSLTPDRFGSRGGNGTKVVGRWVRDLGIDDPRISPSHSWRHRLRTLARRHGLARDLVDAITGHERESVADQYGEYEISALARELAKLP
ncbi:MAG: integrase domain protein [Devosia sp.]|uniref:site-specific integrase n=1 Tax=Devosia sp. TaxID=1871048 RepID=UPI00261322F1|nr:site-specific integrase [Devosia sp.]MDB5539676.1 integrase domain protein [Devosia sp.]